MRISVDGIVIYDDEKPEGFCDLMGNPYNPMLTTNRKLVSMDGDLLGELRDVLFRIARQAEEISNTRWWNS